MPFVSRTVVLSYTLITTQSYHKHVYVCNEVGLSSCTTALWTRLIIEGREVPSRLQLATMMLVGAITLKVNLGRRPRQEDTAGVA